MRNSATLKIPMFNVMVTFVITDNLRKEFDRLVRKYKLDLVLQGEAEGVIVPATGTELYLIISKDYLSHNTIAHESYHIVQQIIKDRDLTDEETAAWLSGHISEYVYRFLDKKNLTVKHG